MSTTKKGLITVSSEWRKHLRKEYKRRFWMGERQAAKRDISKQLKD